MSYSQPEALKYNQPWPEKLAHYEDLYNICEKFQRA